MITAAVILACDDVGILVLLISITDKISLFMKEKATSKHRAERAAVRYLP
jgi:hypothetical protein